MTNTIDEKMLSYFIQLTEAEKKSVLLMLQTFVMSRSQSENKDFILQYNKEIDEALAEIESGQYITQEEFEKQAAKW